jgi:hypothetical protein
MADDRRGNEARGVVADDGDAGGRLGPHLLAALRRLLVLIVVAAAFTVVGSVILGLLLGASLSRSIAIGFYLVGSFWLVSGFFVGNHGPVRLKSDINARCSAPLRSLGDSRGARRRSTCRRSTCCWGLCSSLGFAAGLAITF